MKILDDLKMYGRFALGLRRFLRHTLTLEETRSILQQRRRAVIAVLALSWLAASCAGPNQESARPPARKLTVLALPYLGFAPYFIAQEEGYFAEQGLEIEYVKFNRSDEAIPALAQGELDVLGAATSASVLNAVARGARIKIVVDRGYFASAGCAYSAILARREGLESATPVRAAQLKGRRIALTAGLYENYAVEKFLSTDNFTLDDVEVTDIPSPALADALTKGALDFAVVAEPWATRIVQSGGALWKPLNEILPDFQSAFILYGPSLLDRDPEAGKRFMTAYLKAVRRYNQGKTERNLDILAKHTELDRELLRQTCWPAMRDGGQINLQSLIEFQSWAQTKGLIDRPVTADQVWDASFINHANQALHTRSQ
jgi:NitT/TauT family transport system substrate-binding protein